MKSSDCLYNSYFSSMVKQFHTQPTCFSGTPSTITVTTRRVFESIEELSSLWQNELLPLLANQCLNDYRKCSWKYQWFCGVECYLQLGSKCMLTIVFKAYFSSCVLTLLRFCFIQHFIDANILSKLWNSGSKSTECSDLPNTSIYHVHTLVHYWILLLQQFLEFFQVYLSPYVYEFSVHQLVRPILDSYQL